MTRLAPVLCLGFNRPDLFAGMLDQLKQGGQRELFVAVDGPRVGVKGDEEKVLAVRRLAEEIDWASQIHFKFEDENLGCGQAVSTAIDWVFGQVDAAIILEDDCNTDPSFFPFCDHLLERYADQTEVMQIAASNWGAPEHIYGGCSYGFNSFAPVWGWATWRRAWQHYDFSIKDWCEGSKKNRAYSMNIQPRLRRLMQRDWDMVCAGGGTWDHQWQYTVLHHQGLSISPAKNLMVNTGCRSDGTQITAPDRIFSAFTMESIPFPLQHPIEIQRNPEIDAFFDRIYWMKFGWPARVYRYLFRSESLRRLIRKFLPR